MPSEFSAVVLTLNEEAVLGPTLSALQPVASELIVVDSGSTDRTKEIALAHGARVLERTMDHWANQRNWAFEHASFPWVLVVDADEVANAELVAALHTWKDGEHPKDGRWRIRRKHHFMGRTMRFSGLQTDAPIRLVGAHERYEARAVHEKLEGSTVGTLSGHLNHYTYKSWPEWREKLRGYARRSAADHAKKTPRITAWHWHIKPAFRFVKHYLLRGGILDGKAGFWYSYSMWCAVRWRYEELKRMRHS